MARIRSMKPELRTDLDVAAWPIPARYAWALLWGYLDDSGRGVDDDRLLVADLFPLDRDVTERKFAGWKRLWVDGGQVCRYTVDGTSYLHAIKWDNHQRINRPTPSRIPPCPEHGPSKYDDSLNDSLSQSVSGSVNGSVSPHCNRSDGSLPRAQARASAEQGAGSREKEQGAVSSERADARSGGTERQTLLDEHLTALGTPVPAQTARAFERHIADALTAGTSPDTIRTACAEWRRRPAAKPGLLPLLIGDASRTPHDPDPLADPDVAAWVAEQEAAQR